MRRVSMTEVTLGQVAERFKALGEPARLRILQALCDGELCVGELEEGTGLNQANLSRHLQVLTATGLVKRRKEGQFVHYSHADSQVMRLCEVMCGRLKN